MASGQTPLQEVWAMLDECAKGHTRSLHTHYYSIRFKDSIYPSFPKGEHGKANPLIENGHIRRMARFFGILHCAKKVLSI